VTQSNPRRSPRNSTVRSLTRGGDLHDRVPRETVARVASRGSRGRNPRKRATAALIGAFAMLIVGGAIVPAGADGHHGGEWHGWHGRAWHGHGHHWRGYPYFYGPPPAFFFPPPVVYAPPPPVYAPPPPVVYLPPPPSVSFSFSWPHP